MFESPDEMPIMPESFLRLWAAHCSPTSTAVVIFIPLCPVATKDMVPEFPVCPDASMEIVLKFPVSLNVTTEVVPQISCLSRCDQRGLPELPVCTDAAMKVVPVYSNKATCHLVTATEADLSSLVTAIEADQRPLIMATDDDQYSLISPMEATLELSVCLFI